VREIGQPFFTAVSVARIAITPAIVRPAHGAAIVEVVKDESRAGVGGRALAVVFRQLLLKAIVT
jgi:hypothetical protein